MKAREPWHDTLFGRAALFLGSVRLAVPVLAFVAVALAWGTYLESTQNAKVSKAVVYGSWWFISLMALVCVSLVFAVITRYPWRRKHIGFITVHAGLLLLIAGGFWSMFGRVEGHLALQEGESGDAIEIDEDVLELVEFNAGNAHTLGVIPAPTAPGVVNIGGVPVTVTSVWPNTRPEQYVANDAPAPFRAIEIVAGADSTQSDWIGESKSPNESAEVSGLRVQVLPDGADWKPPAAPSERPKSEYSFVVDGKEIPLLDEGQEILPGWTVKSIRRFKSATVAGAGLSEAEAGSEPNPAVDVQIIDGKGTVERHTAFLKFPDMVMTKRLEGQAKSGATLHATPHTDVRESLVVFGPVDKPQVGYVAPDGVGRVLETPAKFPAVFDLGSRRVTILNQYTRARPATRLVEAPTTKDRRPALVLKGTAESEPVVAAWKGPVPLTVPGKNVLARFGPRMYSLPFTVRLDDFRKRDYPGTEMAMSYESDVTIARADQPDIKFNIFMNNPYAHSPWKVYQSGFMGNDVSVFSVMKDPGIPLTYIGSIVLCVGIYLTFFSKTLSWGHPGIPTPFAQKETANAPLDPPAESAAVPDPVVARDPVSAGV